MMLDGFGELWRAFWERRDNRPLVQEAAAELELLGHRDGEGSRSRSGMGRGQDGDGIEDDCADHSKEE